MRNLDEGSESLNMAVQMTDSPDRTAPERSSYSFNSIDEYEAARSVG
jgi:hypothetical protein